MSSWLSQSSAVFSSVRFGCFINKSQSMDPGEFLTRWTVRIAVVLYVAALLSRRFSWRWARGAWTAGCVLYLLHVVAAFHYYHHWSHDAAYESTARQTADVVGVHWGGGLYVNYAFTLV